MGLIQFRGGSLHGRTYETEALLGSDALVLPVAEYNWTSEKIHSERNPGVSAQVWVHKNGPEAPTSETVPTNSEAAAPPASEPEPTTTPDAMTGVVSPPVSSTEMDDESTAPSPEFVPAAQDSAAETTDSVPSPSASNEVRDEGDLQERRKKLKLSRKDVSEATGLAQSKVWGIETGQGKRIKDEERSKLVEFLSSKESAGASV